MDLLSKGREDDESMSLLPDVRQVSTYAVTATAGGGRYGRYKNRYNRHNHDDSVRPKSSFKRFAGLLVFGIAVALAVIAAVVFYTKRVSIVITSSSDSHLNVDAINPGRDNLNVATITPGSDHLHPNLSGDNERRNIAGGAGQSGRSEAALGEEDVVDNPPNVIFILVDDLGMNDVGSTSTDMSAATPFIQSLVDDGVRIINYYTNHMCTPARASLMSGRDSFRTGMQFEELSNFMAWGLPLDEVTLADRFTYAGYKTHMVGKWNLGMYKDDYYPFNRGFDTFLGYLGPQESYYGHDKSYYVGTQSVMFSDFGYGDKDGYIDYTTNTTRQGPRFKGIYSTDLSGDRAIAIAEQHVKANDASGDDDPLFMYLAFQAAHSPLDVPSDSMFTAEQLETLDSITENSDLRTDFSKIVYYMDITVERIFDALDDIGMMDNTLVVFASDNGGCPSGGGSNYPFRGFKHTLFEGGVRTPALVYSKNTSIIPEEAQGTAYAGMMHAMDWTPTLANITGIPTDEIGKPLSGYDQWSAIIGESTETVRYEVVLGRNSYEYNSTSRTMYDTGFPRGAYINNGWKINVGDVCTGWYSFSPDDDIPTDDKCPMGECPTCTRECKYQGSDQSSFLFHLDEDPYEQNNLLNDMPEKFDDMVQLWNEACKAEVVSNYEPYNSDSVAVWEQYHHWEVAWQ